MPAFKKLICATAMVAVMPAPFAAEVCDAVKDAKLVAQDEKNTYLGKVANRYDSESIFNEYSAHGSPYSSDSIWNKYGTFGSEYSAYAPQNKYTATPPMIVKKGKVIGYLSSNKSIQPSMSAELLKALCAEEL